MPATAYSAIASVLPEPRDVVTTTSLPQRSPSNRLLAPAGRWWNHLILGADPLNAEDVDPLHAQFSRAPDVRRWHRRRLALLRHSDRHDPRSHRDCGRPLMIAHPM